MADMTVQSGFKLILQYQVLQYYRKGGVERE